MMFKRMMIASEMSVDSFEIFDRVNDLKMLGTEDCILLQCVNASETNIQVASYMQKITEENTEKQKEILIDQGYQVETQILTGSPKKEINRLSVDEKINLIVAGAAKHTIIGESLFGGVAYELMYHAIRPLLLVRTSGDSEKVNPKLFDHVLYATDFSENARTAYAYIKEMVRSGIKKITLVHVLDKDVINPYLLDQAENFKKIDQERLMEIKEELETLGEVDISVELPLGSPTGELLRLIDEKDISLAVMGSQGRGFLEQVFLGSVSHNIARHANASVLLIPAARNIF
ncbi:universal stress protein [Eubacteriaceae bacterium ES3]|nr:universal stress protein [Eubacteriaceae bacterium ES3]